MYTFVLEWTPALTKAQELTGGEAGEHRGLIPHGYIFATFMVSCMIGSSLFKIMIKSMRPESFMRYAHISSITHLSSS